MLLNSCRLIGKLNSTNAIMTEWKTTKYNGNLHQTLSWRWWWCLILKQNFCARHWNSILPFLLASKSNWLRYWRSFSSPANEMNFLIQRYFFKALEERYGSAFDSELEISKAKCFSILASLFLKRTMQTFNCGFECWYLFKQIQKYIWNDSFRQIFFKFHNDEILYYFSFNQRHKLWPEDRNWNWINLRSCAKYLK